MSKLLILPIGAGVIGQDDVPLVRIMDSDETPTSITIYGVVDTVQPVTAVTWTVNGVEQTGDVSRSPVLELTDLQPETSYAITLRATNINGESQASARTIWTKKITTITPADVVDGVTYYDYQDVYRTGIMPERDETDITVSGRDVTVPAGHYAESETVSVSSEYIIPTGTKNITDNGNEDVTQYANVNVQVPASAVVSGTKNITNNGTEDVTNYASVDVQVPASAVDVGTLTLPAITQNVTLFTQDVTGYRAVAFPVAVPASEVDTGTKQITSNGNGQDVVGYANVDVNVQPNLGSLYATHNDTYNASQDGYDGYNIVTVDIRPYVIEKRITQNGTYYAQVDDGVDGYDIVNVQVIPNLYTSPSVTPSTSQQTVSIPSGYDGLSAVTVDAVTSAIDANITAGNIRNGVSILGVQGNLEGGTPQNLTFTFADGTSGTYTFYAS